MPAREDAVVGPRLEVVGDVGERCSRAVRKSGSDDHAPARPVVDDAGVAELDRIDARGELGDHVVLGLRAPGLVDGSGEPGPADLGGGPLDGRVEERGGAVVGHHEAARPDAVVALARGQRHVALHPVQEVVARRMAPALLDDPDGLVSAIAACVIGGVDLMGGRGRLCAAVIGTVFLAALRNALNLQGIQPFMQSEVVPGFVELEVAVPRLTPAVG